METFVEERGGDWQEQYEYHSTVDTMNEISIFIFHVWYFEKPWIGPTNHIGQSKSFWCYKFKYNTMKKQINKPTLKNCHGNGQTTD